MQAQLSMSMGKLDVAASLLKEGLVRINQDDWAGYLLYFDCVLPSTGYPFKDAADGVISLEGGFGSLLTLFSSRDWWLQVSGTLSEADLLERFAIVEATVNALVQQVGTTHTLNRIADNTSPTTKNAGCKNFVPNRQNVTSQALVTSLNTVKGK